jgi:exocyst complex protein 7
MVGDKSENDILKEGFTTLRSLCLRSFSELLADIKLAALPTAVGKGGSVDVNAGRFWISLSRYVASYSSPFEWDIEANITFTTM